MEKVITQLSELDLNGIYTYADYLCWRLEERIELIKGHIFLIAPTNTRHQSISSQLQGALFVHLQGSNCKLFSAPFDVRLPDKTKAEKGEKNIYTVVQPDLCVICDREKIDIKGCIGAPDLVVEILSPGNSKKEMDAKYTLYEESGVREYWVVFPSEEILFQFVLNDQGKYALKKAFAEDQVFNAHIFPDLQINLAEVFAE